ncbi:MAG: glycosyltransferase [Anaerolineae bacterium]
MRVLVATNMWPRPDDPGLGVFVRDQVRALRRRGVDVSVLAIDGADGKRRYLEAVGRIRRALATADYDLLHAHYVLTGLAAVLAGAVRTGAAPSRVPLLVTHHGVEVFDGWQAPLSRWVSRLADDTIVVSEEMAEHLGIAQSRVVPMGIDLDLFRPCGRDGARRALGLPQERQIVAWIGADRPEKRLGLARAAVDTVRGAGTGAGGSGGDVVLHVVSGRPHEEVATHLQAADCLLLTSRREGAPMVVKEALACDVPVVSTAVGDVPELLDGVDGCTVAAPTPAALAAGINRALAHGPVDGRARAARFGADAMAARVLEVYEELARAAEARHAPPR